MFEPRNPYIQDGMVEAVQTIVSQLGRTIEELLQDDIFAWFPIVGGDFNAAKFCRGDEGLPWASVPLLHLAIILITTPPPTVTTVPDSCDPSFDYKIRPIVTKPSALYKVLKAMCALTSSEIDAHTNLIQTLGLIALYEFGLGMFNESHRTLTSAFSMISFIKEDMSYGDRESMLSWRLCLITLDRPKFYEQHDRNLKMYEGTARAGRVLQHLQAVRDGRGEIAKNADHSPFEKELMEMFDQEGNIREPDFWSAHDPQILSVCAVLIYGQQSMKISSQENEEPLLNDWYKKYRSLAWKKTSELITASVRGDADVKKLSVIGMFSILHNMTYVSKNPGSTFSNAELETFRATLQQYALRWPFVFATIFNMSNSNSERHFFNYPEAQEGPRVPYVVERNRNPVIRGPLLVAAAFLMEWIKFIRETAWANAGFAGLRKIRTFIEYSEPRYDPTVVPLPLSEAEAKERGERVQISALQQANVSQTNPSRFYSAADYRTLYLSGELTPVDVVKAILPLIDLDGPQRGRHAKAWREINIERIMRAAEASTERYKNKQPLGPLDGVPSAIKDDYDLDGYTTTLGSLRDYTEQVAEGHSSTSWIVRKLEEAGVVIIGKLAMHEFGLDTTGNNPNQGTPPNPFNSGYYTGGSSSGPAYAVSSGLIPLALGSDGGGSIRIPGSFCSVFGLKPTHNRLASWPGMNHSPTCAVQGPLAVDMQSLAAAYEAIAEPHPSTQFPPLALQPSPPVTKVLGIFDAWISRAAPGVQSLVRGLVESLAAKHGYTLVPIEIPFPAEGQMAHALTVLTDASTLLYDTSGITPANKILLALGRTTPSTDYLLAQKLRGMLMQHLAYLWKTYPGMLIITPTTACAGAPIRGGKSELSYGVNDGNYTLQSMEYVWLANFCGLPAITVPAGYVVPEGRKDAGEVADKEVEGQIPVGLMATGEWCSEDALLQFGFDAEAAGQDIRCKPPIWEDVISRAKAEASASRPASTRVGSE
ncbi:hypothetical protein F53441_13248 [Fusarium austroafricanum]|uniref:Amidase domain-containing protein n=1 Tax=Fusarium austroafricanum TaxID=2364996 RepID=A0A8H4NKK3_9HYPO|nr:hypothetical protein F53441_13248 [Fusarium austroafricanum]